MRALHLGSQGVRPREGGRHAQGHPPTPGRALTSQNWLCPLACLHPHSGTWVAVSPPALPWQDLRPQPGVALPHPLAQGLGPVAFPWSPHPVPAVPRLPWNLSPPVGLPQLPEPYLPWGWPDVQLPQKPCSAGARLWLPPRALACQEGGQPPRSPGPPAAQLSSQVLTQPLLLAGLSFPP